MKRKILCAFLAVAMLLTAVPSALAAKKVDEAGEGGFVAGSNIYTWGTFDSRAEAAMVERYTAQNKEYHEAGLDGGCLKVSVTGSYQGARIPAPLAVGETYEISMDIRTDNEPGSFTMIMYWDDGGWSYPLRGQFTKDWTRVTGTWTNTGINNSGVLTSGTGGLEIRYADGMTAATFYIDNFSIVPRGDVVADYSSLKLKEDDSATVEKPTQQDNQAPVDVEEVTFSDMENHWAKDTVNTLATYGYIDGIGNNLYSPNTNVTRAQFVKMIADTYDMVLPKYDGAYSDIKGNEWFASYITLVKKLGFIDPALTVGGTFKPDQAITREEAASIAAKVAAYKNATVKENIATFKDEKNVAVWAKEGVKSAAAYGLIKGYEDGTYRPQANITRAEAAQILMRVAEIETRFSIYVDADNGNDKNEGTKNAPLKTLVAARNMVRTANKNMKNDITVYIRGRHYLSKTLELGKEDSGNNGHRVIYTSWGDEKPVLTMGKQYTGFELHDAEKNIYRTYVGNGVLTRQVYFNDVRGIRARSSGNFTNPKYFDSYYISEDTQFLEYEHPEDMELVWHINWCNPRAVVESVEDMGDGTVKITPVQSQWSFVSARVNTMKDNELAFPSYYENAYELLNASGEWYMNKHDGFLYYIPRADEDMSTMVATIPSGEQLLSLYSNDVKNPVRNITFNNLQFSEIGWNRPTIVGGHADAQNNHIRENGDKMPGAALKMENIRYINFTNNDVTRVGCTGLETKGAIQHVNIIGNEFYDISGTAVTMGGIEDPVKPTADEQYNQYNKINNNYIHHIGLEYMSAAGISAGWPRHSEINHNEIACTPYSGMHIGYGWASYADTGTPLYDFEIGYNYIHEFNNDRIYDGGGIYTIGASSLDSEHLKNRIVGNYFEGARDAYGSIYPDEGSTHWHIYNNVSDYSDNLGWEKNFYEEVVPPEEYYWFMIHTTSIKYNIIEDNYSTHAKIRMGSAENTVGETYEYRDAEWPEEAQAIKYGAGIEPEYKGNFDMDGAQTYIKLLRTYTVAAGETASFNVKVCGRYLEEFPMSDFDIRYTSSDPSVLRINEDNTMTAVGTGVVWVEAVAFVDGIYQQSMFKVYAGDKFEGISLNANALNLLQGYTTKLTAKGTTTFGREVIVPPENIQYISSDESVITVDGQGNTTAVGKGEATITVRVTIGDFNAEQVIPVKIITYTQEDSLDLPYNNAPRAMFAPNAWTGSSKSTKKGVAVSGSPAFLTGANIDNQLIAFDMQINNPNSWPSLVMCAQDPEGSYKTDSCYMIGFKDTFVEVQRFNSGVRTMIFGDYEFSPIGGLGIPNIEGEKIYEYGEKMSVVVGTLDTEEGTRIVLHINGKNVFDYLDTDENALPASGLFGIYNPGTFEFSPYTGIVAE